MNIYHLSHIDLDGYGCQYLTNRCFESIKFYNANYGNEIKARLEEIVSHIKQDSPKKSTNINYRPKFNDERVLVARR
jgi:oligoribonuclease NrnB/cAMP/cGMP phosphodiesterase (DHH superfamily)